MRGGIRKNFTQIKEQGLKAFKSKVKRITRRNVPVNLKKIIVDLNPVLHGFANYFKVANRTRAFRQVMSWIRRRLRAIQVKSWKKPRKLHRRLRQLGYKGECKSIRMSCWRNASCQLCHMALPNAWFDELGLFAMNSVKTGVLPPINRG